jgi:hypothetical protein
MPWRRGLNTSKQPSRRAAPPIASGSTLVFNVSTTEKAMATQCPTCKSFNTRRSSIRAIEASARPLLRSPHRCLDCGKRFWVISRRARYAGAVLVGIAVVAIGIAWTVGGTPHDQRRQAVQQGTAAAVFADTLKAAEQGDSDAEYRLSHMYAQGTEVDSNKQEALMWLERAAKHGDIQAQYEFGNALREGLGVVQDYEGAIKWLQLAAQSGNPEAQYALGQMYRAGMGVDVDNAKAYVWFNLAASHDVPAANVQRDAMLRTLTSSQIIAAQAEARRLNEAASNQSTNVH